MTSSPRSAGAAGEANPDNNKAPNKNKSPIGEIEVESIKAVDQAWLILCVWILALISQLHPQPIIGQFHSMGKLGLCHVMVVIVGQVSKISPRGADSSGSRKRF